MKYRKLFLLLLLFSLTPQADTTARTKTRKAAGRVNNVEFDLCYDFSVKAIASKITFTTIIPQTIPGRQQILHTEYSREPSKVFSKDGNKYAEFVFNRPQAEFRLKINIKAKLLKYDLAAAQRKYDKNPAEFPELSDFLNNEKHIEKDDPLIQQAAKTIKGKNQIMLVRKIYDYVTGNLKYISSTDDLGAVKALRKKQPIAPSY